jgi:hypothetical protein
MRQIPKELIAALNSGQCIAVVGSGPSNELGYPSWKNLADETVQLAKLAGGDFDEDLFVRLLKREDYPKVFKYTQELVARDDILTHIARRLDDHKATLAASPLKGKAYSCLTAWPFKFYITTNWDAEIARHLEFETEYYSAVSNSKPELTQLSVQTTKQIVHAHGVLCDSESVVLTDDDYQRFRTDDSHRYFHDTLVSLFRTFPILIVGHSMRDPDLQTILESAKKVAPSRRTVFMIAADVQKEDIDEYLAKYNIHIISYNSRDNHRELQVLLTGIDRFVIPRREVAQVPVDPSTEEEIEFASSLLFANSLFDATVDDSLLSRSLRPQILHILDKSSELQDDAAIRGRLVPETMRAVPAVVAALPEQLEYLASGGLIEAGGTGWRLTDAGKTELENTRVKKRLADEQVISSLVAKLKRVRIPDDEIERLRQSLVTAIASIFRKRGVAAASFVFRNQPFEPVDMAELFEAITRSVSWIADYNARQRVVEFVVDLFTTPTEEQRYFLARLSQGCFAVHVFGATEFASKPRAELFRGPTWTLDSNVLIYLFAEGSSLGTVSREICTKCKRLGIQLYTTKALIEEALKGLGWASNMCNELSAEEEMEFILQVFNGAQYRQNPYIEGFVGLSPTQKLRRFAEYERRLDLGTVDKGVERVREFGVEIISIGDDASDELRNLLASSAQEIETERLRRGTGRGGERQAFIEAEVLCLLVERRGEQPHEAGRFAPAYFVSTSRLLDQMYGEQFGVLSWTPETLFRHLSLLSPGEHDDDAIVEAMAAEYSDLGITLIDQNAFRSYFDPLVSTSKLSYQRERAAFIEAVGEEVARTNEELDREFDAVPDIAKPLFVSQMMWREQQTEKSQLRRELKEAVDRHQALDKKLKAEEKQWDEKNRKTIEHYENRIRNLTDPKRRKKTERKRRNKQKRKRRGK